MYIQKLSIRNFRNFKNASFDFVEGVNTILGENGTGKTNLFYALRLLIDNSLPRRVMLHENDFNRSISWRGHWIIIQIIFDNLDPCEEAQSISMHQVGESDMFDSKRGMYALYFRPKTNVRQELFELSESEKKDKDQLDNILSKLSLNDYECVFTGRGNTDFSIDKNYNNLIGDFDKINFPNPNDCKDSELGVNIRSFNLANEFSCTHAKALRDVESDLRSYRNNPLLNLLRDEEKNIDVKDKDQIEKSISELNSSISELAEIKSISEGIITSVREAVGDIYAPNLSIKSELPDEMEKLLYSLRLWVGDPDDDGHEGKLHELSLGGANIIYISLKLLEYERVQASNLVANFILIEEPEAHLHTHIQKTLFQKLDKKSTQIFISSHSTHISSVSEISSMNILGKGFGQSEVYSPSKNLDGKEVIKIERYLDASRSNLIFAKSVMLVEGDAESILIPKMVKTIFGISLDEIGVSVINIGSTRFQNIATIFHEDRIKKYCSIVTDLDKSIVVLPDNPDDDSDYEKKCRGSQKSGQTRKIILDDFSKDNKFINIYYGENTFEVEFAKSNDSTEIIELVEEHAKKNKLTIKNNLESGDVALYGRQTLQLAERYGKGWFAIMLCDYLSCHSTMPDYILYALAFCCQHINERVLFTIAEFRINELIRVPDTRYGDYNFTSLKSGFDSRSSIGDKISFFTSNIPDDDFSIFIAKLNCLKS